MSKEVPKPGTHKLITLSLADRLARAITETEVANEKMQANEYGLDAKGNPIITMDELTYLLWQNRGSIAPHVYGEGGLLSLLDDTSKKWCKKDADGNVELSKYPSILLADPEAEKQRKESFVPQQQFESEEDEKKYNAELDGIFSKQIQIKIFPIPFELFWQARLPKTNEIYYLIEVLGVKKI